MLANKRVRLSGLKTAAMNGRVGLVLPQPAASADRVQVLLSETRPGLGDSKTVSLKPANLDVIEDDAEDGSGAPALALDGGAAAAKAPPPRPAAMTGRPGPFKLGYDWREVLEGQEIPRGLEIMASLEQGVPTIARIPGRWMLDVFLSREDHVRFYVTRATTHLVSSLFISPLLISPRFLSPPIPNPSCVKKP
ncbi:hypothetical protein TeGR_g5500 [Tetraparma gracilis]|uniref:Uncharacterized protein n=1 Tax=Tetraparma gracilis TaxID=2962635 RepID=A0ABQ6MH38_9STRA|nr:hypothetical protein TeGR_g5500 [Tetraparma gracilis]